MRRAATVACFVVAAAVVTVAFAQVTRGSKVESPSTEVTYGPEGFDSGSSAPANASTSAAPGATTPAGAIPAMGVVENSKSRVAFQKSASKAVKLANAMGGDSQVAIWPDGWKKPVLAGTTRKRLRMWSMSKPVAATTLLTAEAKRALYPSAATMRAMRSAITRSENCKQRQIVLALQEAVGGPTPAARSFKGLLAAIGAKSAQVNSTPAALAEYCRPYMSTQTNELKDAFAPALQLGITTWTVKDAVSFAHGLGVGKFGAPGDEVKSLMRLKKRRSREIKRASEYTAATNWGAGQAFPTQRPAYKAGWGGATQGKFLVGQIVHVTVDGQGYAIAAMFEPSQSPSSDDPGLTVGPDAITSILRTLKSAM